MKKNTTFSKIVKKRGKTEIVNKKHKNYTQKRYYNFKKGHFLGPFLIKRKLDKNNYLKKKWVNFGKKF